MIGLCLCLPASVMALGFSGVDLKGKPCSGYGQGVGPFDYTNPEHLKHDLPIVERYHFTPEVEQLIRGKSASLPDDLDYTLRAFPNHHRALFALIRYATDSRRAGQKLRTPPECYLQRALTFQPKDGNTYLLFGLYLHKLQRLEDAEPYYRNAVKLKPGSAEAHYNLGLLLTDRQLYDEAEEIARKAYQLGYPLPGLKRRLAAAGHPLKP